MQAIVLPIRNTASLDIMLVEAAMAMKESKRSE
jgi:hypothetical protein